MKVRFAISVIFVISTLFIPASQGFLDPETNKKDVKPSALKSFIRINLDRSETLNDKNPDETTTITQKTTSVPEITTKSQDVTTEKESTTSTTTTEANIHKKDRMERASSTEWFLGGAFAGMVVSFVVFYTYSFFKFRTGSVYDYL